MNIRKIFFATVSLFSIQLFFPYGAYATDKIIRYEKEAGEAILENIVRNGGKILKKYSIIDAALVSVPDEAARSIDVRSVRGLRSVEDDEYRYWLAEDSFNIPSVKQIKKKSAGTATQASAVSVVQDASITEGYGGDNGKKAVRYTAQEIPWGIKRINAPAVWGRINYSNVRVAVLDTGINYDHPDLKSVRNGYNAIDPSKPALDDHGHGTHIAGTIAAVADGHGVAGVVPGIQLYSVKVLDSDGGGRISAVASGVEWAVKNGMNVLNMSISSRWDSAVDDMITAAYKAGITIVASAGNYGNQVRFPANMEETIAVGAIGTDDTVPEFSCRGRDLDFVAPGVDIYSTTKDGGWGNNTGTSMACPHVTGLAALAVAAGARGPEEVRTALKNAASQLSTVPYAIWQGNGLIDAVKIKKP